VSDGEVIRDIKNVDRWCTEREMRGIIAEVFFGFGYHYHFKSRKCWDRQTVAWSVDHKDQYESTGQLTSH
jgi:hypothetical protein